MKINRNGITRTVFLVGPYAIKVPCVRNGWRLFLTGLLANLHERIWAGHDERLCPIVLSCPLGTFIVMRRAESIEECELPAPELFEGLPLDYKAENFGRFNGRIVLVDYG